MSRNRIKYRSAVLMTMILAVLSVGCSKKETPVTATPDPLDKTELFTQMAEYDENNLSPELLDKIELFTRMQDYDEDDLSPEKKHFLVAKTIEREENKMYNDEKAKNIYNVDFSSALEYIIAEQDLVRLLEDLFVGSVSPQDFLDDWEELSTVENGQKVYTLSAIGYAEDSEEIPYKGGRYYRGPNVEKITKIGKDLYEVRLTFEPTYSGPAQDFTEEDIEMYAKQGITITDDHLFHFPKEYGKLTYQVTESGAYRILTFETTQRP